MTTTLNDRRRRSVRHGNAKRTRNSSRLNPQASTRKEAKAQNHSRSGRRAPAIPAWKRGVDLTLIVASLPLAIPLMVAVAIWIRLVSKGPALFRQERVGFGEKKFTILKFRSMYEGAATRDHELHVARLVESDCSMVKLDELGDSRLIWGGCFLRATGMDELPQLLNVLRGEMSLVGPRPCVPEEHDFFTAAQRERFRVLPGLTGLWQVNGKNRRTFREMSALDVAYARHSSPGLDLAILVRTPMALFREVTQCIRRRFVTSASQRPLLGYCEQGLGDRP